MREDSFHSRPAPEEPPWDSGARYWYPGERDELDRRMRQYPERSVALGGRVRSGPLPMPHMLPPADPYAARFRERSPPELPWPALLREYPVDRAPPQRSIMLEQAGRTEQRIVIRRPLSPDYGASPHAWHHRQADGPHRPSRRGQADLIAPPPGYADEHLGRRESARRMLPEGGPYWEGSPRPDHARESVLHASRGPEHPAASVLGDFLPEPSPRCCLYAKLLCELRPPRRLKQSSVATLWPHQDCGQCLHTFSCSKERTRVEVLH